jgi:hypothetical protein
MQANPRLKRKEEAQFQIRSLRRVLDQRLEFSVGADVAKPFGNFLRNLPEAGREEPQDVVLRVSARISLINGDSIMACFPPRMANNLGSLWRNCTSTCETAKRSVRLPGDSRSVGSPA